MDDSTWVERRRGVDLDWHSVALALAAVVALILAAAVIRAVPKATTALALSFFLVLALDPVIDRLQNRFDLNRGLAVGLVFAGFAVFAVAVAALLVPPTIRQASELGHELPTVTRQLGDLPLVGPKLRDAGVPETIRKGIEQLPRRLSPESIGRVGKSLADALVVAGATLLLTVGLLLDGTRLLERGRRMLPERLRQRADRLGGVIYEVVGRYAAGSMLVAAITAVLVAGAGLALRVPLTPLVSLWAGLWDLVPQVGGAVGGFAFILLGLTRSATTGLICAVVFGLYLQLRNHVIGPIVAGHSVKISPLATTVAVLVGVSAGGFLGGLVAVPLAGIGKAVWEEARRVPGDEADGTPTRRITR